MGEAENNTIPVMLVSGVLAAGIFALDLSLPRGVAGGVPYVIVVLISLWLPRQRDILIVTAVCTGLTILGFYYSSNGSELWFGIVNRILTICVIWATAILSYRYKRSQEELRERRKYLEKLLAERSAEVRASEGRFKGKFKNDRSGVAVYRCGGWRLALQIH